MYQLYYYPGNASLAAHFVLRHLQLPHVLNLVDRKTQAQKSADYLRLNPLGRIPVLIDGEQAISESAAICLYLAEQTPAATLVPAVGSPLRGPFLQWLMFLTNSFQADMMVWFYPEKHCSLEAAHAPLMRTQEQRIDGYLLRLEQQLAEQPFVLGERLTICDFYLLMLLFWARRMPQPPMQRPILRAFIQRMVQRPAVIDACAIEGIDLKMYQADSLS